MSDRKIFAGVYLAAAITVTVISANLSELRCKKTTPAEEILMGAGWPVVGLVIGGAMLLGKRVTDHCSN